MYDRHLDTFVAVADCGSFLKASARLYISANAVTKQINLLEHDLGVKLFERTHQGLTLTEAGKLIDTEARKLIRHSRTVLQKAKELEHRQAQVIKVGVSLMNPANLLLEYWHKASALSPDLRLEIVPFQDTIPEFLDVLDHLGDRIDLLSCPYETTHWGDRYNAFHLCDLPMRIACSKLHPLAAKERLEISDLFGQTVYVSNRNETPYLDRVGAYLEQFPQIHTKAGDVLDLPFFNQLVSSQEVIVSADCWKDVHPLLATIPVNWDFTMPYGLIYAKEPSQALLQFLQAIETIL